jgi:hypothetical protein
MNKKPDGQIEISQLINNAVNDAVVRRHQAIESEAALTNLSIDEVEAIRGGLELPVVTIAGRISVPQEEM